MTADFEQLLGYVDGIDASVDIKKIGEELLVLSCWTPGFCSTLIRAAEAAGGFSSVDGDPVPG